ncbi:hypothetical protein F5Y03DRAFT_21959 [Xylaria venustula]|nr:hypothetical protein F5Y03DRAFT_21959 [Xylaria venustula]
MSLKTTVRGLIKQHCPQLDTFTEETLRIDTPVPNIIVMTCHDAVIFGHRVPANTHVFLNLTGPSLTRPSVPIAERIAFYASSLRWLAIRGTGRRRRTSAPNVGCGKILGEQARLFSIPLRGPRLRSVREI